jgi:hypothetical protein
MNFVRVNLEDFLQERDSKGSPDRFHPREILMKDIYHGFC